MLCVGVLQRGNSGDGCDLAFTLCKFDLFGVGKGVTSEARKYLVIADYVWWWCVHYFGISSCG